MVKGKLYLYKLCLLWCVCCDKYELCAASLEICSDNQMQTSLELWRHVCITHATKVHLINCYIIFSVCFWPKIRANYVVIGETLYWCFSIKNIAHWKCFQMSLFCQITNCCSKLQNKILGMFLTIQGARPQYLLTMSMRVSGMVKTKTKTKTRQRQRKRQRQRQRQILTIPGARPQYLLTRSMRVSGMVKRQRRRSARARLAMKTLRVVAAIWA